MGTEFSTQLRLGQRGLKERSAYFLATAAGACIGFAITQTAGQALEFHHMAPAAAVLLWATSFLCGYNCVTLDIAEAEHALASKSDDDDAAKMSGDAWAQARKSRSDQVWTFLIGVLIYIGWHIYQMWLIGTAA